MSSTITEIPLDSGLPGTLTYSQNTLSQIDDTSSALWFPSASHIELEHVGIRKVGMISMPASSAWLSLHEPFVVLPDGLFNIILQAARTSREQNFVVDCEATSIMPDIVFGLRIDEDVDADQEEFVITPDQYVLEIEQDKCILLARNPTSGRIGMGWAAIRGRKFVSELHSERVALF
jgi:hypothetical protein